MSEVSELVVVGFGRPQRQDLLKNSAAWLVSLNGAMMSAALDF
jgi:hypothetical protein